MDIVRGIIRRRTLLALVPWDPTSWVFMYYASRHKYEVNLRQHVLDDNQLVGERAVDPLPIPSRTRTTDYPCTIGARAAGDLSAGLIDCGHALAKRLRLHHGIHAQYQPVYHRCVFAALSL